MIHEDLAVFTELQCLCLPNTPSAAIDPSCTLPHLHWFVQFSRDNVLTHIVHNLTHLYFNGAAYECIDQLVRCKLDLQLLTRFLVVDSLFGSETESSLERILSRLHHYRHGIPDTFEVFVLMFNYLTQKQTGFTRMLLEKIQKVLDLEPRALFWSPILGPSRLAGMCHVC